VFSEASFNTKLSKLLDTWSNIRTTSEQDISMADAYQQIFLPNQLAINRKLESLYGPSEHSLSCLYDLKETCSTTSRPGSYHFERTDWSGDFLELFFKLGFDQTEQWEQLIQSVNTTPLLPEFYEAVRGQELGSNNFVDKQHLMPPLNRDITEELGDSGSKDGSPTGTTRRRRSILCGLKSDEVVEERQVGLFRSYSIRSEGRASEVRRMLAESSGEKMMGKKSVSFTGFGSGDESSGDESSGEDGEEERRNEKVVHTNERGKFKKEIRTYN